jgi:hypothetical protein
MTCLSVLTLLLAAFGAVLFAVDACGSHGTHPHRSRQLEAGRGAVKKCGTDDPSWHEKLAMAQAATDWKKASNNNNTKHRSLFTHNLADTNITIPVYFHILQYNQTIGTMKQSTITEGFLPTLNKAYAGTPFRFALESVHRIINPDYHNCTKGANEQTFKEQLRLGDTDALNVYICNAYDAENVSGWSYYPSILTMMPILDGIVMQNPELYNSQLDNYYSLVHESGHTLGLLHTFGKSNKLRVGCAVSRLPS